MLLGNIFKTWMCDIKWFLLKNYTTMPLFYFWTFFVNLCGFFYCSFFLYNAAVPVNINLNDYRLYYLCFKEPFKESIKNFCHQDMHGNRYIGRIGGVCACLCIITWTTKRSLRNEVSRRYTCMPGYTFCVNM